MGTEASLAFVIIGYTLGSILIITCGVLLMKYQKRKKEEELPSERQELIDENQR